MFKSLVALALAPVVGLIQLAAGAEKREWQMGTLLQSERTSAGMVVFQNFKIEGPTLIYVASQALNWGVVSKKPANLTVNGPVKFAVEKRKLFVIDEDGKEHKMQIVSKELRQPGESPKR